MMIKCRIGIWIQILLMGTSWSLEANDFLDKAKQKIPSQEIKKQLEVPSADRLKLEQGDVKKEVKEVIQSPGASPAQVPKGVASKVTEKVQTAGKNAKGRLKSTLKKKKENLKPE